MYENCRDNKHFLIYLDTEVRNNNSITKIWLCKVMSEKRGSQVTKSPPINPPLIYLNFVFAFWSCIKNDLIRKIRLKFKIYVVTTCLKNHYNTHIAQYLTK